MNQSYWDKARAFHGHACPGLAIGVKVCEAVVEKMGVGPALDEELVCVVENDACGVDAIQALVSCTFGKGNLIYKDTGKHAYTFFNRKTGKAMRFYFKAVNSGMDRDAFQDYLLNAPVDELFDCREEDANPPGYARKFPSVTCEICGESAAESKIRLQEGKKVCLDCFKNYGRFIQGGNQ
ncbi:MAG: FmdE family protein [Spirochaetaceae bacterium]|jgi:formylmethanofuran dehydrogenase subunit E|nr:FmdE family protein [Spirochaetaceae bacterium]